MTIYSTNTGHIGNRTPTELLHFGSCLFCWTADSIQRDCTASCGLLIVGEHGPKFTSAIPSDVAKTISGINNQLYQDKDSDDTSLLVSSCRGLANEPG